ncbi:hypothetical protein M885DRAFT_514877 [Pelagophyceae sp. CCMP2097]|nr:hypothetical protein M885DRAFT_514877 [Pelagophyceae sp. CCMP2097]
MTWNFVAVCPGMSWKEAETRRRRAYVLHCRATISRNAEETHRACVAPVTSARPAAGAESKAFGSMMPGGVPPVTSRVLCSLPSAIKLRTSAAPRLFSCRS